MNKIKHYIWNLQVTLDNAIEKLSIYKAKHSNRTYKCRICGTTYSPKLDGASLLACGWGKIHRPFTSHKRDCYICHECLDHRNVKE